MRQRLIYLLKHNIAIQRIYHAVMSAFFRALGIFLPTDDMLVLFVSYMGTGFNDSPRVLFEYLQNHAEYKGLHCVWAFEYPETYPELDTVKIDSIQYFVTALKAKYWITNTNIERGLRFKKRTQVYLNTWHGIALKHIGNDCPGRKDYNFDTVDHLVVSGIHDERVWKTAFRANPNTYLRCGMPRNEELWMATEEKRQLLRQQFCLPDNKKIILYAPTWRESTNGGKSYEIKPPIHFDIWKRELKDNYIILFRAHHQTTSVLGVLFDEFVINVSDYSNVNDLMIASDILITDYSAIAFDYSILAKPIFCYAYDYDAYLLERGTYFRIDDKYPNKCCRTEEELLSRIRNMDYIHECENTRRFRDEFIQYGIGATEACIKAEFGNQMEANSMRGDKGNAQ